MMNAEPLYEGGPNRVRLKDEDGTERELTLIEAADLKVQLDRAIERAVEGSD